MANAWPNAFALIVSPDAGPLMVTVFVADTSSGLPRMIVWAVEKTVGSKTMVVGVVARLAVAIAFRRLTLPPAGYVMSSAEFTVTVLIN